LLTRPLFSFFFAYLLPIIFPQISKARVRRLFLLPSNWLAWYSSRWHDCVILVSSPFSPLLFSAFPACIPRIRSKTIYPTAIAKRSKLVSPPLHPIFSTVYSRPSPPQGPLHTARHPRHRRALQRSPRRTPSRIPPCPCVNFAHGENLQFQFQSTLRLISDRFPPHRTQAPHLCDSLSFFLSFCCRLSHSCCCLGIYGIGRSPEIKHLFFFFFPAPSPLFFFTCMSVFRPCLPIPLGSSRFVAFRWTISRAVF